ncbi:MAG: nuclear transport factor 2 family protein [Nannocystaceae bacterium]|nr:nuclear transport factor 2 family protein [Nannocystaceae bacterium]
MSVRASLLTAACLCLLPLGCGNAAFGPEDATAIRSVMDAQQASWNAGDVDAFMQGYHQQSDVVFTSGGKIRKGWEATLTAYQERYVEGDAKMGTLAFSDVEIQPLGPGAAVVLGRWKLTETPQAGQGVFSLVFTEVGDRWAILHDHSSSQ